MQARRTRKASIVALALVALLATAVLTGCGSSSDTTGTTTTSPPAGSSSAPRGVIAKSCRDSSLEPPEVRAIGASCAEARATAAAWRRKGSCSSPAGSSRYACSIDRYRCLGATTDRGIAVNCATSGRSISFIVKKP